MWRCLSLPCRRFAPRAPLAVAVVCVALLAGALPASAGATSPSWLDQATLTSGNPGENQRPNAALAFDADDNAYVAWQTATYDAGSNTYTPQIWYSEHTAGGSWAAPELVDTVMSGTPTNVRLAVSASGEPLVAWEDDDCCAATVVAAERSAGAWSTSTVATGASIGSVFDLGMDSAGDATLVWPAGSSVVAARRPAGGSWTTDVITSSGFGPGLSVAPGGDALISYTQTGSPGGIYASARSASDSAWGAAVQLAGPPPDTCQFSVLAAHGQSLTRSAVSDSGIAAVTWQEQCSGDPTTTRAVVRAADGTWGAATDLDVSDHPGAWQQIAVAADAAGDVTAAWMHTTNSGTYTFETKDLAAGGSTWGAAQTIASVTSSITAPVLRSNADGDMVAAALDTAGADSVDVAQRPAGGTWQTGSYSLSDSPNSSYSRPAAAIGPTGQPVAAWGVSFGNSTGEFRYSAFDAGPTVSSVDIPDGFTGQELTFSAQASGAWSSADSASLEWDFGDGSPTVTGASVTHTYSDPDSYTVTVTATDGAGVTATSSGTADVVDDVDPPDVTITTPADGQHFTQGDSVDAAYSCTDTGTGLASGSCAGPVADGDPLDTSTVGTHSFTVVADDNAGNETTKTHDYVVDAPAGPGGGGGGGGTGGGAPSPGPAAGPPPTSTEQATPPAPSSDGSGDPTILTFDTTKSVTMPDVVRKPLDDARAAVLGAGIRADFTIVRHHLKEAPRGVLPGGVYEQSPAAGTMLTSGIGQHPGVSLSVYTGPTGRCPAHALIRGLDGMELDAAIHVLASEHCNVDYDLRVSSKVDKPTVDALHEVGEHSVRLKVLVPKDPADNDLFVAHFPATARNSMTLAVKGGLTADIWNSWTVHLLPRNSGPYGTGITLAGARIFVDSSDVQADEGDIDKRTDGDGNAKINLRPHKAGLVKIAVMWTGANGRSVYGATEVQVTDRSDESLGAELPLENGYTWVKTRNGWRENGRTASTRARAADNPFAPIAGAISSFFGQLFGGSTPQQQVQSATKSDVSVGQLQTSSHPIGSSAELATPQATKLVVNPSFGTVGSTPDSLMALPGGYSVIAPGGGNVIAPGGGNVIAAGGGNVIAAGGGNRSAHSARAAGVTAHAAGFDLGSVLQSLAQNATWLQQQFASVIAAGGGNVIAAGGGNVIAAGGGNVIAAGGGNVLLGVANGVIAAGGGNVIAAGGGNVIAAGGGNVIAAGGGNVIAAGGGNVIAAGGGN